jgi:hypothetical protein
MKKLILPLVLLSTLLTQIPARAELLVYKGIETETITGQGSVLRINSKVFVIVDHETGQLARLAYATINGVKRHSTSQDTNTHIVQVSGKNDRIYSVISRIPSDCEGATSPGHEALILKGANATLTFKAGETTSFPRTLTDYGIGFFFSTSTGEPGIDEGKAVLVFSQKETIASNTAGESLDMAYNRLLAYVQSLGFTH